VGLDTGRNFVLVRIVPGDSLFGVEAVAREMHFELFRVGPLTPRL
jgi:hypothetical protein